MFYSIALHCYMFYFYLLFYTFYLLADLIIVE